MGVEFELFVSHSWSLFRNLLPIFLVADQADVIFTSADSERSALAGGVFLTGVPKDLIAALLAFVISVRVCFGGVGDQHRCQDISVFLDI